jgi:hypothetical protein
MKQNTERKLKNEIRMVDMKEIKCFCLFVRQLDDRKRHGSFDCLPPQEGGRGQVRLHRRKQRRKN